jgi:hypothetical protein
VLILLAPLVLAALPEIDDVRPFEAAARDAITTIPGCYAMSGTVSQWVDVGVFGHETEGYSFHATLDGGRWSGFEATRTADEKPQSNIDFSSGSSNIPFFPPLLGRLADAEQAELSLMDGLLRALETEVETVSVTPASWEGGEGYQLIRLLESKRRLFGGTKENRAEVLFDAAPVRPRVWHVTTEIPLATGEGVRLRDIDVRLAVTGEGVPTSESLDAVGVFGPFALKIRRSIAYVVDGRCPTEAPVPGAVPG